MKTFRAFGQCGVNVGRQIMDINGYGPLVISCKQWDDVDFLLSITTQDTNGWFNTTANPEVGGSGQETARSGDTQYNGDGTTLAFTHTVGGAGDLGNSFGSPVVPGTLRVIDSAGVAGDIRDTYADGVLYYVDTGDVAGSIDYEDGYLTLAYPTGYAPGTAADAINCTFQSGTWITGYGNHVYMVNTPLRDQPVRIVGLAKKTTLAAARIDIEMSFSG